MPKAKGGQPRVEDLFRDPDAGAKNAYLTRYLIGAVKNGAAPTTVPSINS